MSPMAILTDVTKCIGCEECVAACKKVNQTGADESWRWQDQIDSLSATRWTTIAKQPGNHYVRKQCRHCLEPACVSVCPVGAMQKTPEGPVIYDSKKCLGCRYCMMSCPYGIPRYTWEQPVAYVRKCVMCYEKIKSGELKQPACTAACPKQATIYGERSQLLAEAHGRIAQAPSNYINKVWGEDEVGGTSVLYISDIPLDFLGWKKDLGAQSLPSKTWRAMEKVPPVFISVGIAMYGIYWIIERRRKLAGGENSEQPNSHHDGDEKK